MSADMKVLKSKKYKLTTKEDELNQSCSDNVKIVVDTLGDKSSFDGISEEAWEFMNDNEDFSWEN